MTELRGANDPCPFHSGKCFATPNALCFSTDRFLTDLPIRVITDLGFWQALALQGNLLQQKHEQELVGCD